MADARPRVLLVDDDADFACATAAFLESHGYDVAEARDAREGLLAARRTRPDLILMDVMMKERTEGFFAVQELRRDPALAGIPVFVVSSLYSDVPGFRVAAEHAWLRHDEFLPKPLDLDQLLERIRARLGGGASRAGASGAGASGAARSRPGKGGRP